jgi:hypothetical protein
VNFKVKFKSSVNEYVSAVADVIFYDSDDNIISVQAATISLGKKETSTREINYYNAADIYDHYEVVVRAFSSVYNN